MKKLTGLGVLIACGLAIVGCGDDEVADEPAPTETSTPVPEGVDPLPRLADEVALPLVFVHGFAGSAQQYESQAMRFVANGHPQERILAYDDDGAGVESPAMPMGSMR